MDFRECELCIHKGVCKKKVSFNERLETLSLNKTIQELENDGFEIAVECRDYREEG